MICQHFCQPILMYGPCGGSCCAAGLCKEAARLIIKYIQTARRQVGATFALPLIFKRKHVSISDNFLEEVEDVVVIKCAGVVDQWCFSRHSPYILWGIIQLSGPN